MGERFRGERSPMSMIEEEFGPDVARVVERLRTEAQGSKFESMMITLQRMLTSEQVEIGEDRFEQLTRALHDHKEELGLENETR